MRNSHVDMLSTQKKLAFRTSNEIQCTILISIQIYYTVYNSMQLFFVQDSGSYVNFDDTAHNQILYVSCALKVTVNATIYKVLKNASWRTIKVFLLR